MQPLTIRETVIGTGIFMLVLWLLGVAVELSA
jgi:hypothetical protein